MSLRVAVQPLAGVDAGLRTRWAELAARAAEPNACAEPPYALAAARHLPGGGAARLLTVHERDRLVLAWPVRRGRYRRLPVPAWLGWRHPHSYLGTPLLDPQQPAAAGAAVRHLLGSAAVVAVEDLPLAGPVAGALAAAPGARAWRVPRRPRPVLRRADPDERVAVAVGPSSAKSLRRSRRRLAAELGAEPVLRDAAAAGEAAAAVEQFLALEAAGWKGPDGGALAVSPGGAAFLREACAGFAAEGRLELWQLGAGGRVAAAAVAVRSGHALFHVKIAYDEALARCSPGVQLEHALVEAFDADRRLLLLDPCTPDVPTVSDRLYPHRRAMGTLLLARSAAGRAALALGLPLLAARDRRTAPAAGGRAAA